MIRVVGLIRSIGMVRRRLVACRLGCILGRVLARVCDAGTCSSFFLSDYGGAEGVMVNGCRPSSGAIAV